MAVETAKTEGLYLPTRRLWTRQEFDRATESGLFGPDEKLELIEGEVITKMTQNSPHAAAIRAAEEALRVAFSTGYDVRVQMPLALGVRSQPEPDVAVVTGSFRDYTQAHPTSAVLIVEVSNTTLLLDRMTKTGLYARAGIAEYWIVNLTDRLLKVHCDPARMTGQPLGHHYRSVTRLAQNQTITPLAAPDAVIVVADLLP